MNFFEIVVETILSVPFQENCYLVYQKKQKDCFLVDPGFDTDKIIQVIEKKGLNPVAILVTHGHADHIGGIDAIKNVWENCKIHIGEEDKEKLTNAEQNLSAPFGFTVTVSPADVLLRNGDQMEVAGIPVEVRHVPGHSKGHVVYHILTEPKSILFVGDVIFRQSIGRHDFPDGNPQIQIPMIRSQILSLPDETIIYPGHGELTNVGDERRFNPYLT